MTFAVNDVVANRYEIRRFIARGGMGEVYAARDRVLDTEVAVKTLRPELEGSSIALERFRREIGLARNVTHPNVCRMFDVGEHDGHVFLTMELLEGSPLPPLLELPRLEEIARQLVAGLTALHAAGVVHRDFKTSNVIIVGDRAVITDFGLARAIDSDGKLTGDAALLGTPAYMAPEQVEGRAATPASDVYALGVVLFELLTGKRPFVEETAMATAMARLTQDPPRPSSLRPEIPARWDDIVLRCLVREPEARPKLGDVLAAKRPRPRWLLPSAIAGAVLLGGGAVAAWQLRGDAAPILAPDDAVAVLPVGDAKTLFTDPVRTALTIDIYELVGTAHVPVVDMHSRAMDLRLMGPPVKWSMEPDPLAAAFAFPRVARVVQPAFERTADRAVLTVTTTLRDRTRTVRTFERPAAEVALLANDAARAIASHAGHGGVRFPDPPLTPEQYAQYGAGIADLYRHITEEEIKAAPPGMRRFTKLAAFSDAVPRHARSAALVADFMLARAEQAETYERTMKQRERALAFVDRALAADPDQAIGHAARAHAAMIVWDWKLADTESRRAVELSTYARLGNRRKFLLQLVGRFDEWIEAHLREPVTDPGWTANLGYTYFYARRYDDCIRTLAPAMDTFDLQNFVQAISATCLATCYSALGRDAEALAVADKLEKRLVHDGYARSALIPTYVAAGKLDFARKLRDEVYAQGLDLGQQALIDDAFGDYDIALTKLEQVVASHNVHAMFLKIDRYSPALRAKPRFHALMQKVGFL